MANKVTANVTTEAAFRPPLSYGLFIFSLLQLLAWLLPNHYFPWATYYQEFLSALALLSIAFAISITNKQIQIPRLSFVIAAISLIPLIQWQLNIIPFAGDAVISSLYLFGLGGAIAIGYNLRQPQFDILDTLAIIFLAGGLISSLFAMSQWLEMSYLSIFIEDIQNYNRPYANFAQPNNLATFIMCSLISLVYLWEKEKISSRFTAIITPILILGLALPQSRTTLAIAIILGIWWLLNHKKLSIKINLVHILIAIFLYVSFIYMKPAIEDFLLISNKSRLVATEIGIRTYIWTTLLDAVVKGPNWGFGWQGVSNAQISVALDHPTGVLVQHSHNLLVDLLVWNGRWLGGLLILFSAWWFINQALTTKSKASYYAFAIILTMTTHAMLEYPLHYAFFLLPLGLLVGYVEHNNHTNSKKSFIAPRFLFPIVTILSLILLVAITREYIIIEKDLRLLRYESARIGSIKAEQSAPDIVILTQLREFLRFARTEAKQDMTAEQLINMKTVAHRSPFPASIMRYSLALSLNNKYQEASTELQILRKLHGEELYQEAKDNFAILAEKHPELRAVTIP